MPYKEQKLNLFELLSKIDNDEITSTKQLDFNTKGLVHNNPELISGNTHYPEPNKPIKNNLKLTKQGEKRLRLLALSLEDIDNSYGKGSFMSNYGRPIILFCVLGLIGFSAKWVWENKLNTDKPQEKSVQKTTQEKSNLKGTKQPPK